MSTYERIEFSERARRVFSPGKACAGSVKIAANGLAERLGVSWGRAKELVKGRALPTVREMDLIRELDGVWCNRMKRAKAAVEDKIEDIWEFVTELKRKRKERSLSKKGFIERAYVHQDDRA
jgi:hypothetical protein